MLRAIYMLASFGLALVHGPKMARASPPSGHAITKRTQAILGGLEVVDPAVVGLARDGFLMCGGTQVAPELVVTAGHCAMVPNEVWVRTSTTTEVEAVAIEGRWRHPQYVASTLLYDIGLLWLKQPAETSTQTKALNRSPLDERDVGRTLRLMGYGALSRSATTALSDNLNAGTSQIESVEERTFFLTPTAPRPCFRDSGGAVLSADEQTLVGIVSGGDAACETFARAVRVDVHIPWIDAFVDAIDAEELGVAEFGTPCLSGDACRGDLQCFRPDLNSVAYCTLACTDDAACGPDAQCDLTQGFCALTEPPGRNGGPCENGTDCGSGQCLRAAEDDVGVCTRECQFPGDSECVDALACVLEEDLVTSYCSEVAAPLEDEPGCNCRSHAVAPQGRPIGFLLLSLGLLCIRRRRIS